MTYINTFHLHIELWEIMKGCGAALCIDSYAKMFTSFIWNFNAFILYHQLKGFVLQNTPLVMDACRRNISSKFYVFMTDVGIKPLDKLCDM